VLFVKESISETTIGLDLKIQRPINGGNVTTVYLELNLEGLDMLSLVDGERIQPI
jgi:hypothetical protein